MTELSDELLVAYVDGQLQYEQARAVDRVLEQDEVAARRLEALRGAHGRFETAFEAILAGELAEIRHQIPIAPPPVPNPQGGGLVKIGIATVGIGLVLASLVAGWPVALPDFTGMGRRAPDVSPQAVVLPPTWQDRALSAQSLLSRASVEIGLDSQANRDLVSFQLGRAIGPTLKVPNLDKQGFKFVRAQLLRFGDRPLAQMLYLGAAAKPPIALYAMGGVSADSKPAFKREGGIGSVAWKDGGIAYLLAGEEDDSTLLKLADAIGSEAALPDPPTPKTQKEPLVSESKSSPGADPLVTGSTTDKPAPPGASH